MKIKIIKGVYGHRENGITVPKTSKSDAFEVTDAKAKELIEAGIAKKFDGLKSQAEQSIRYRESLALKSNEKKINCQDENKTLGEDVGPGTNENPDENENTIEYSMDNKKDELLKIAEDLGIEINDPEKITKKEIIELLDEATAGDDAPQFGDENGIVE